MICVCEIWLMDPAEASKSFDNNNTKLASQHFVSHTQDVAAMNMKLIRDSSDNGVFKLCCWNGSIPFVVYDHIFCEPRKILASGI